MDTIHEYDAFAYNSSRDKLSVRSYEPGTIQVEICGSSASGASYESVWTELGLEDARKLSADLAGFLAGKAPPPPIGHHTTALGKSVDLMGIATDLTDANYHAEAKLVVAFAQYLLDRHAAADVVDPELAALVDAVLAFDWEKY